MLLRLAARRCCRRPLAGRRLLCQPAGQAGAGQVDMEEEKRMADVSRAMMASYGRGNYADALESADELRAMAEAYFGPGHPVVASAVNNRAMMLKQLGRLPDAMDAFHEALQLYDDIVGQRHPSYATALHNVGAVFRAMAAEPTIKALERDELRERALEHFEFAREIRDELLPAEHPDRAATRAHLAGVYREVGRADEAEAALLETVAAFDAAGKEAPALATALNNLGFHYKGMGLLEKGRPFYERALDMRARLLGDAHPDTITAKHNLAELLMALGDDDGARELQESVLDSLSPSSS